MQTAELVALPLADRLQAMEALWESLCRDASPQQVIPAWHDEVLRERMAKLEAGSEAVTPWEQAKHRIREHAQQLVSQKK